MSDITLAGDGSTRSDPVKKASSPSSSSSSDAKPARLDAEGIKKEISQLNSSPDGLSSATAKSLLEKYGPNAIEAKEDSRWKKLLGYFWGPIPWMIEIAALISLARQDWPDFIVITGLLLYNAAVGFWQDNKAASALAALKKGLALKAHAKRDGKLQTIDAAELVPGDVVTVSGGEILPADLLLIDGAYLSVDQAALTGESLPVSKMVGDSGYSGSIARQGSMTGIVTSTGNNTFFGRTAKLVASAGAKSHAEQAVLRIGDFLIILAAILALILVGTQLYKDIVVQGHWAWSEAGDIAQFVLVLLIASVPVAMPAVMSVTMALGALALSKQKAIVSRLSAIEELAGVDVLCSDKTGTLTQNHLTVDSAIPFDPKTTPDEVILGAALACQPESTDAIDQAVLSALKDKKSLDGFKQVSFTPFDPVNKKTLAVVQDASQKQTSYAKDAHKGHGGGDCPFAGVLELGGEGSQFGDLQGFDRAVARRYVAAQGVAASGEVAGLFAVGCGLEVGEVGELVVRDVQVETIAECSNRIGAHFLQLMVDVLAFAGFTHAETLDGFRQDHGGLAAMAHGSRIGVVDLVRVVSTP